MRPRKREFFASFFFRLCTPTLEWVLLFGILLFDQFLVFTLEHCFDLFYCCSINPM